MIFNRTLTAKQIFAIYNNRTDMIHSEETSRGEIWQACITPNDGLLDGSTLCSNNLTILNSPPEINQTVLNATNVNNRTTENLTLYYTVSDSDGDSFVTAIEWYNNSILYYNYSKQVQSPETYSNLYMPFDNATVNNNTFAQDESDQANHGTVVIATFNSTGGYIGGAYYFDGAGDYIGLPY